MMVRKPEKKEGMRMNMRYLWVVLGITILVSGCSTRIADMTLMTTRIVSLDRVDLDKLPTKRVIGEDTRWTVLFIPLGFPTLKDAVDDALNKGGGDLMTDAVVRVSGWTAILFGANTIQVTNKKWCQA
jgi:hypothetical protein